MKKFQTLILAAGLTTIIASCAKVDVKQIELTCGQKVTGRQYFDPEKAEYTNEFYVTNQIPESKRWANATLEQISYVNPQIIANNDVDINTKGIGILGGGNNDQEVNIGANSLMAKVKIGNQEYLLNILNDEKKGIYKQHIIEEFAGRTNVPIQILATTKIGQVGGLGSKHPYDSQTIFFTPVYMYDNLDPRDTILASQIRSR